MMQQGPPDSSRSSQIHHQQSVAQPMETPVKKNYVHLRKESEMEFDDLSKLLSDVILLENSQTNNSPINPNMNSLTISQSQGFISPQSVANNRRTNNFQDNSTDKNPNRNKSAMFNERGENIRFDGSGNKPMNRSASSNRIGAFYKPECVTFSNIIPRTQQSNSLEEMARNGGFFNKK